MVAVYLKEFDNTLILEGEIEIPPPFFFIFHAFKKSIWAVLRLLKVAYSICINHIFKPSGKINYNVIVLYDPVPDVPVKSGYRYYYGSLFDSINDIKIDSIGYACTGYTGFNSKQERREFSKNSSVFFLLDHINTVYLMQSIFINIYIMLLTWVIAFRKLPCSIKGSNSFLFWKNYLFHELDRVPCLSNMCNYMALKSIFKQSSQCKLVIYLYEEKGLERAILLACKEHGIRSIGYTPNPQYRTALSMRDDPRPASPKPSTYAVCGPEYVDFFVSWGKKDNDSISVWGSEKSSKKSFKTCGINRSHPKILFLLSHPNELKTFHSWLRANSRISCSVTYLVRSYKAVNYKEFEKVLTPMMNEFNCVMESHGDLNEDLEQCDLTVFCATSAGLVSVNYGYLSIYLDLNDFLEINPCFDNLDVMLYCKSPAEFAVRLNEICNMSADSIMELYQRQLSLVDRIFSPIQTSLIEKELLC
ncbi:MAG: hypothetical protein NUV74_18925 [Candidatus Brocadiaceae bacterium]|nr:hypothetical protein [Candidatus Brocadiaceae bacterium]